MRRHTLAVLALLAVLAPPAAADVARPTVRLDGGATPPTECRPWELFLDSNADGDGSVCFCKAVNTWKCASTSTILHALSHENGGSDEIDLAGLSGLLADPQLAGFLDDAQDTPIDTADTPADGDVLKYDDGAGLARWAPGTAAGFTSLDADYGDETVTSDWDLSGGTLELPNSDTLASGDCDDPSEYNRVAVDNDAPVGQRVYLCTASGWVLQGGDAAEVAPYGQYDPDNPPASGGTGSCLEEFAGSETCTWSWGNQGSSTATIARDALVFTSVNGAASESIRCYLVAAPAAADFTITALVRYNPTTAGANQLRAGVALLEGTLATPTKIWLNGVYGNNSLTLAGLSLTSWTSYTGTGGAAIATWPPGSNSFGAQHTPKWYLQWRYDTTANTAAGYYSPVGDGKVWESYGTGGQERTDALSTDPDYAGLCINNSSSGNIEMTVDWVRLRTDANRNEPGE